MNHDPNNLADLSLSFPLLAFRASGSRPHLHTVTVAAALALKFEHPGPARVSLTRPVTVTR